MLTDNNLLKVLIHDAKLACRSKFIQVVKKTGSVTPKLEDILRSIKGTFKEFDRPNLWLHPIPFDDFLLIEHTLTINEVADDDIDEFDGVVMDFLQFLRNDILHEPLSNLDNNAAAPWNDRVFNALVAVRRRIGQKKAAFRKAGINHDQDANFRELSKKQNQLTRKYSDALNNNDIVYTEKDKKILDGYDRLFKSITIEQVKRFKQLFARFTNHLETKVPV